MNKQIQKKKMGRPTVITDEVVQKLSMALCSGYSVTAACYFAGVSRDTYYSYLVQDRDFSDKMVLSEEFSTYKARVVILQAIDKGDVKAAQWWLERKARLEFAANKAM